MKYLKYYAISLFVIVLDQVTKMAVYFNMSLGEEIPLIGKWLKLHYTLNPGMAMGIEFGSKYGKLGLTFFRLFAMIAGSYYIYKLIKKNANPLFLFCTSLILGGASGNLIDSIFYGYYLKGNAMFVTENPMFYPWFHGRVIDMIYVDIWSGTLPKSIPFLGGTYMAVWPIFNVADSAIFIAFCLILIFQNRIFPKTAKKSTEKSETNTEAA